MTDLTDPFRNSKHSSLGVYLKRRLAGGSHLIKGALRSIESVGTRPLQRGRVGKFQPDQHNPSTALLWLAPYQSLFGSGISIKLHGNPTLPFSLPRTSRSLGLHKSIEGPGTSASESFPDISWTARVDLGQPLLEHMVSRT